MPNTQSPNAMLELIPIDISNTSFFQVTAVGWFSYRWAQKIPLSFSPHSPPFSPPSLIRGVSALSPSIDLPPFMSCLMKRGSKKEICPSETQLDQGDVFTSNEAARPRFSGSQADGLPHTHAAGGR